MTAVAASKRRRVTRGGRSISGRRRVIVVGAGCAALVAGVTAAFLSAPGAERPHPSAAAVQAWQAAIRQPVQHWGRIEVLGMQPAISDLRAGTGVPAVTIAGEARAWQSGLRDVRARMDAAMPPGGLLSAARLFDQAVVLYLQAAETVEQAASGPQAARLQLIDRAVRTAMRGDCAYDSASVVLQQARLDAGLGTTADFPDHTCASTGGGG